MKNAYDFVVTMLLLTPIVTNAASNFQTDTSSLTTEAHLYFVIKIPKILYVRINPDRCLTSKVASSTSRLTDGALIACIASNKEAITSRALNENALTNIPNVNTKIGNTEASSVIYTATMP